LPLLGDLAVGVVRGLRGLDVVVARSGARGRAGRYGDVVRAEDAGRGGAGRVVVGLGVLRERQRRSRRAGSDHRLGRGVGVVEVQLGRDLGDGVTRADDLVEQGLDGGRRTRLVVVRLLA